MIVGIGELNQYISSCPLNFVRLGMSFSALWATHLKPAPLLKPRLLARQLSDFKSCLGNFKTDFSSLARGSDSQDWEAKCKALARVTITAVKEMFDDPVLNCELPDDHPSGQRWFTAVSGAEWPQDWGDAGDLPPSPHLERLFELVCELYRDVGLGRQSDDPDAEPELGAMLGIFFLQAANAQQTESVNEKDLSSIRCVLRGIQRRASSLGLDLNAPKIEDLDGIADARIRLSIGVLQLPKFKKANTESAISKVPKNCESEVSVKVETDWLSEYKPYTYRELQKVTGISHSVLHEKWSGEEYRGKPVRREWKSRGYWLRVWIEAHQNQ